MRQYPLLGVSILVVALLMLGSLSTVVGHQTVPSSKAIELPPWPTEGIVGKTYSFCIQIPQNPEQDLFWVFWDWGDGVISGWLGPFNGGEITCSSHAWNTSGAYMLRCKLKDSEGNEVEWMTWVIHIYDKTTCELISSALYFGKIWFDIKNVDEVDAVRLNWSMIIEVIVSPPSIPWSWNGTITSLEAGKSERISTNRFLISFGFRKITMTITAFNVDTATITAKVLFLGPLIILAHPRATFTQTGHRDIGLNHEMIK